MERKMAALRIDDVFASTKRYEVYGRDCLRLLGKPINCSRLSNFLFMKYAPGFRRRLPYREIDPDEWSLMIDILRKHNAKLTVGVTAVWVERNGEKTPFFEKFPEQAAVLKQAQVEGLVEIANHGFTHCVVGRHLPRLFSSNRTFHREFWDWVPADIQREHLRLSQGLLNKYFGRPILTFVPPGNVWTEDTERFASEFGIKYLSSREDLSPTGRISNDLLYIGDSNLLAFHDRDIVLNGTGWFINLIKDNSRRDLVTVKELAQFLRQEK